MNYVLIRRLYDAINFDWMFNEFIYSVFHNWFICCQFTLSTQTVAWCKEYIRWCNHLFLLNPFHTTPKRVSAFSNFFCLINTFDLFEKNLTQVCHPEKRSHFLIWGESELVMISLKMVKRLIRNGLILLFCM